MSRPQYLAPPAPAARTYGTLDYDAARDQWVAHCEPAAAEFAKRLFPGIVDRKTGELRFGATRRLTGELNWFLLRYPLNILAPDRYASALDTAVAHADRRSAVERAAARTPPATFTGELYPFQQAALTFLIENERTLLAAEQGLGKTVVALAALATANAFPALLVVPPGLMPQQWVEMTGQFLNLPGMAPAATRRQLRLDGDAVVDEELLARGARMAHVIRGTKPYELPPRSLYVIHYGLLAAWREHLEALPFKAVVFDEVHELRHTGTSKYSAASILSSRTRYAWGLSGTPIFNYGGEIWSVLNALDFHCLSDEESFTREWGTGYGDKRIADPDALGAYLREEGLVLRQVKRDVQSDLPPKVRKVITLEHDDARFRDLVATAARAALGYDTITDFMEKGRTKRYIEGAARKAAGVAKAPAVAAFVAGLLKAGERVLVFAHHHDVHDVLRDTLSAFRPVSITGQETEAQKHAAKHAFTKGDTNLAIIGVRGARGLDGFQKRGTTVVFAELDWAPAVHAQAEDRLHRMGLDRSLKHVMCYYLVSQTGIDETMQEALGLKKSQFVGIMGDDAETDDAIALHDTLASEHMDRVIDTLKQLAPAKPVTTPSIAQEEAA